METTHPSGRVGIGIKWNGIPMVQRLRENYPKQVKLEALPMEAMNLFKFRSRESCSLRPKSFTSSKAELANSIVHLGMRIYTNRGTYSHNRTGYGGQLGTV